MYYNTASKPRVTPGVIQHPRPPPSCSSEPISPKQGGHTERREGWRWKGLVKIISWTHLSAFALLSPLSRKFCPGGCAIYLTTRVIQQLVYGIVVTSAVVAVLAAAVVVDTLFFTTVTAYG